MANEDDRILEGDYATIYELRLHETTRVETGTVPGKNTYGISQNPYTVTRVHGGWIYSRYAGASGPAEHFVPDTKNTAAQGIENSKRD